MLFRKLVAVFVVIALLGCTMIPVYGVENNIQQSDFLQERAKIIDELITLDGEAARAGKTEESKKYLELLKGYGVETITTDDQHKALVAFGLEQATTRDYPGVPEMEDTYSIRWYKTEYKNYFYYMNGKNYDLTSLRAEPINAAPSDLFINGVTVKNPNAKSIASSLLDNGLRAIITTGLEEIPGASVLLTAGDVIRSSFYDSQRCREVIFPRQATACTWSAQIHVTFWYIKYNGSQYEPGLYYVESKVSLTYGCTATVNYVYNDGSFQQDILYSGAKNAVFTTDDYYNFGKICIAYDNNDFYAADIGAVVISFAGESVTLHRFFSPLYPQDIS